MLVAVALTLLPLPKSGWPEELSPGSARGFNVLVITLDTTRADRLGCYGHDAAETPVLDALAGQGVRFDDAVTVVPITLPSHATIMTGLDPPNHGARNNGEFRLDDEHETLAEVLRDAGYETAAFISAFVLDARFGLNQGFDLYDDEVDRTPPTESLAFTKPVFERPAGAVTATAIRWLAERDRGRPFFCWVHYFDPHQPWQAPPPFASRFRRRPYDGEIAYMDAEIGKLVEAAKTHAAWNRTLIVVVGDHGEGLGDHDETTHSKLIYDTTMRVPLVFTCPGLFRGPHYVDDRVVSIADIFPTVLDLIGVESDKPRDGRSLVDAHPDPDRMIYLETLAPYFDHGWSPLYGIRRHRDKYILAPRPEYYDLNADPDELNDLYGTATGAALTSRVMLASELSARLAEWPSLEGVVAVAQPLDPGAIRKLESLGYVGTISEVDTGDVLPDPKDMMPVMRALDRADGLAAAGQLEEALDVTKEAAALSPDDPKVRLTMGHIYLQMGKQQEAEASFRAAAAHTSNPRMPIVAAQLLVKAGQPAKAVEFLEPLRESHPDSADALVNLGVAYLRLGRLQDAHETLLDAERLDETRFETYINLATCLTRMRRPGEALIYADKAVAMATDVAEANHVRGSACMQLGDNEEALRSLTAAVVLDPRNPRVVQDVANVCARLGRYQEALAHYATLARLLPTRWEPQLGLASMSLQLGELEEAQLAVDAGLRLAPNEPRLRALAQHLAELRGHRSTEGG